MTRVDFYVLPGDSEEARLHFACRLVEKATRQGHRAFLALSTEPEAARLDALLWTYRPESFVPHSLLGEAETSAPVVIAYGDQDDPSHHDFLINLSRHVPKHFSRFQRLAEIVIQEHNVLAATRERFAFYRERGYPLETHKL